MDTMLSKLFAQLWGDRSPLYAYPKGILRVPRGRSRNAPPPFDTIGHAGVGLKYLLDHYAFETVIDVGSGTGRHASLFEKFGKTVTRLDYGVADTFTKGGKTDDVILTDIVAFQTEKRWDCVWASHIMEHQRNVGLFISKLFELTHEGGIVAITVPPVKQRLAGGHLTMWNQGLVIYNCCLAGIDMSEAEVFRYGGNITMIVRKKTIDLPKLGYDKGDIEMLQPFIDRVSCAHSTEDGHRFPRDRGYLFHGIAGSHPIAYVECRRMRSNVVFRCVC